MLMPSTSLSSKALLTPLFTFPFLSNNLPYFNPPLFRIPCYSYTYQVEFHRKLPGNSPLGSKKV